MAKRFIDTGLFDDAWFMELSVSGKLLWIYLITKCNHAGIIEMNKRLIQFQTGIKSLDTVIKELDNRLVTVKENPLILFIPKYIFFQYPNFPQSNVKQQYSAIQILLKYGLYNEENLTLSKELPNSYDNDNDNVVLKGDEKKSLTTVEFYKKELELSNQDTGYKSLITFLYGKSEYNPKKCDNVLGLRDQLTFREFKEVQELYDSLPMQKPLRDIVLSMDNKKDLQSKYKSFYRTLFDWVKREVKK